MGTFRLGDPEALPQQSEHIKLAIDGQHARATVDRVFVNDTGGRVEGTYEFTVGDRAKVTGFSYWNGRERIVGEVLPRGVATEIYESVVNRNRDPGLLEEIGPGVFGFRVFPIDKRERKRVQVVYDQWVEQHGGVVVFRTPVTSAKAEITIDLRDARGIVELRSPTHDLRIDGKGEELHATATARTRPKELVLRWKLATPPMTLHGWSHRERGQDAFVLLSVAAPPLDPDRRVAKDITLVLDESGSMNGQALDNGKHAAAEIVRRLAASDRLNVILFDDRVEPLFDAPRPVNKENRAEAIAFLEGAGHGGGTDIASALGAALKRQNADERPKSILLITDGNSDRDAAFDIVAKDRHDVRLFTVGIGADTDQAGLTRLAEGKRGRFTQIDDAAAIPTALGRIYDRIEAPAFVDLELQTAGGTLARMYPQTLPDLMLGDELVIAARVRGSGPIEVTLRGRTTKGKRQIVGKVDMPAKTSRDWVAAMWARARIDDLTVRLALEDKDSVERIEEITRLGVAYDIVTPYTAFLAIPESELTAQTRALREEGRKLESGAMHASRPTTMMDQEDAPILSSRRSESEDAIEAERAPMRRRRGLARKSSESEMGVSRIDGAGCAHCDVGGPSGSPLFVLLGMALAARRRRRS